MLNSLKSMVNKQSVNITERDNPCKVKYLGNVLTSFMRGDGCVDRPLEILWKNYLNNERSAFPMKLTICSSGLKVETEDQGLTEYRWHRIIFCANDPNFPRLFVWVYKHEGRKMKIEQRCHAVLCKSEEKAASIYQELRTRRKSAFQEYTREKVRNQNSRLAIERSKVMPSHAIPKPSSKNTRTKFLSLGSNFRPPSELSTAAPKLQSITEGDEEEEKEFSCSESVCLDHEVNMPDYEDDDATNDSINAQPAIDPERFSNESGFLEEADELNLQKF